MMQRTIEHQTFATPVVNEQLVECFRHELSAVETYQLALESVDHVGLHRALQELLVSHARRVDQLRASLQRQGGDPPNNSGVWGVFAKAIQKGADLLGDRAAIAALEQGEDRGISLYAEALMSCDPSSRTLIAMEMMPEQQRTHALCLTLKNFVNAPS